MTSESIKENPQPEQLSATKTGLDDLKNANAKLSHPRPPTVTPLTVGDRVRYVGLKASLSQVCGERILKIDQIEGDIAICSYSQWLIQQKIPLSDLRLAGGTT